MFVLFSLLFLSLTLTTSSSLEFPNRDSYYPSEKVNENVFSHTTLTERTIIISHLDSLDNPDVFTVATWNVRNFGASNSASFQTDNVITVLRTLKPDLIAIQELKTKSVLDDIVEALPMYDYVFAEYISTGSNVSLGFIYSPDLIEPIYSGAIDNLDQSLDNSAFFSNAAGRIPLAFQFELRKGDGERTITAINIHGKANTGNTSQQTDSYNKRKNMADALYGSIVNNERSWGYVLMLGDYNDDLDKSIFQSRDTPYLSFVNDEQTFWPVTLTLSENGVRSMTRYSDIIDHITVTRRFQDFQSSNDEDVRVHRPDAYLPGNYEDTSDHFPVVASFDMNVTNTSLENGPEDLFPNQITLFPAYPNPFNPETRLTFRLSTTQQLKIMVFDVTGRLVDTISDRIFSSGPHTVTFDGQELSSGMYMIAFESNGFRTYQYVTLIK